MVERLKSMRSIPVGRAVVLARGMRILGAACLIGASAGIVVNELGSASAGAAAVCQVGVNLAIVPTIFEGTTNATKNPDQAVARVGDKVMYHVTASLAATDCKLTTGTIFIVFPSGSKETFKTKSLTITPGSTQQFTATAYVVSNTDINRKTGHTTPTPGDIQAAATVTGKETHTGVAQHPHATTTFTIPVIHPETTLTKSATPSSGAPPLHVTYTFHEKNVSTTADPVSLRKFDSISTVTVSDSGTGGCSPAFATSSAPTSTPHNASPTNVLKPGVTWTYTCSATFTNVGTFHDQATATGKAGDTRPAGTPTSKGAPSPEKSTTVTVMVTSSTPVLTTTAGGSSTVPGTVHDTAKITGGNSPKGTITFRVYSTGSCSPTKLVTTKVVAYNGDGTYLSGTVTVSAPATYFWKVSATVTRNNAATTLTSPCGANTESVTVTPAMPTLATKASATVSVVPGKIKDTASITGGDNPSGTITFKVYSTSSCSTLVTTKVVAYSGDGSYVSGTVPITKAGTYYWVASATVTSNNKATSLIGVCGAKTESVRVNNRSSTTPPPPPPPPSLKVVKSSTPPSGSSVAPTTTVTYTLTFKNSGTGAVTGETMTDTVPAGTTYVTGSATCGGEVSCSVSEKGGVITWKGINVAAHGSLSVTFQVVVNSTDVNGQKITNFAVFTNQTTPTCSTATCRTNIVTLVVVVRTSAPTQSPPPTTPPPTTTPPPPPRVSLATTVHTGEPWAGSAWIEITVLTAGLFLLGLGEGLRRRRRPTVSGQ